MNPMQDDKLIGLIARWMDEKTDAPRSGRIFGVSGSGNWVVQPSDTLKPEEVDRWDVRIEPASVPEVWQKVLGDNQDEAGIEHVGVCYGNFGFGATTLYHRLDMTRLSYRLHEHSAGTLVLAAGGAMPIEGKPNMEDSDTEYFVGSGDNEIGLVIEDVQQY